MHNTSPKVACLLIAGLTAALLSIYPQATSTAAGTHTVTIRYDVATQGPSKGCITDITVDPWSEAIDCDHHIPWCNGDSASPPEVIWRVDPPTDKYSWKISHKPVSQRASSERDHFPPSFAFIDKVTHSADGNLPAILKKGDFPWTYTVSALPAENSDCAQVDEDPEVIFKGGGGYSFFTLLVAAAAGLILLFAAPALWRRLRSARRSE